VAVEVSDADTPRGYAASPCFSLSQQFPGLWASLQKKFFAHGSGFALDVELFAPPGITILFGASGAGKTTLLDCIAGLVTPDAGRIAVNNFPLFDSQAGVNVSAARRAIGYVFQDLALFPHLSVEKNIKYGLSRLTAQEKHSRVISMLKSFGLQHVRERLPQDVSGGERQRAALARALVLNPRLLLLDEPLAALDAGTKAHIIEDLRSWNESHGIPILYVTHSREEVFALGERVVVLGAGRIVAAGSPHEVMTAPRQESVANLFGFENIFDATVLSIHESRGTMTCRLAGSNAELETPLLRATVGANLRVGIRAGDILLATEQPKSLSARNILSGKLIALARHDVIVSAKVDCGVEMEVHLTLAAHDALALSVGRPVWLVLKTHSCHLMAK
jgi:molybdate transport system ATP-binding protein